MPVMQVDAHADSFRAALASFASNVIVLTAWEEGRAAGMTATAFSSVSLDPMLVLVCVNRSTRTFARINAAGSFGVNILSSTARDIAELCARNGQGKHLDAGSLAPTGTWSAPALRSATAFLDCDVSKVVEAGTHAVLLGSVAGVGLAEHRDDDPLIFFRGAYRQLQPTPTFSHAGPLSVVWKDFE